MAEQQNGLRFDIYERVHLSEGVTGIKQLEEVELVPHIQVLTQGDQAVLRGNLLLNGTYMDEQDRSEQVLEHLIPVEITLPANRVQRLEDIHVEIENFDVDLLSTRSLNITGVLSLNGLELTAASVGEPWQDSEEEAVFVSEVSSRNEQQEAVTAPVWGVFPDANAAFASAPQSKAEEIQDRPEAANTLPLEETDAYAAFSQADAEEDEDRRNESIAGNALSPPQTAAQPAQAADAAEALEPAAVTEEVAPQPEAKKEVKVALGAKNKAQEPVIASTEKKFGIASLISSGSGKKEPRTEEAEAPASETIPAASQGVQWKKLLPNSVNEQQEFKRVRICIVQKEETLESIAERYELNPREIALFNRLGDSGVSEGQIVYIPK